MSKAPIKIDTYRDGGSVSITINDENGKPVSKFFINGVMNSKLKGVLYYGTPGAPQGIVQNIQMLSYVASVASVAITEGFTTNENEINVLREFVRMSTSRIDQAQGA